MESITPNFNKKYIVFGHGARMEASTDNFKVDPNYRIVTTHIPGEIINTNLVKIILNQIDNKINEINNLFTISCPIGRNEVRKILENNFIKDYIRFIFKKYKGKYDQLINVLEDINIIYDSEELIRTIEDLNEILNKQNYDNIKRNLNFELRTYRPGDLCPKLLLDFKFKKSLSLINPGIFESNSFQDFDYDEISEKISIQAICKDSVISESASPESLVDFNNDRYVLNIGSSKDKLFLDKIKTTVPTGLLVILSCGFFNKPQNQLQRHNSLERQKLTYGRKYVINYNN